MAQVPPPRVQADPPFSMNPLTSLVAVSAASLLIGCATKPLVFDGSHPASAAAPEAFSPPARSTLRPDENTRRTRELLTYREQEAKAAEAEPPADETHINLSAPAAAPSPASGAGPTHKHHHEHH